MKYIYIIICALLFSCNSRPEEKIFYYENGNVKSIENYKNSLLDGVNIKYYSNGNILMKGNYKQGLKDGLFYGYLENGKIRQIDLYKNGKHEGLSYEFHPRSPLKFISSYKNDSLVKQTIIDTLQNHILYLLENDHSFTYFKNGKLQIIENGYRDKSRYYKVEFSISGVITKSEGNLFLMTNKDSTEIYKSYPRWNK